MWNDWLNRVVKATTFPEKEQGQPGSQISIDKYHT
jgi:hypothetical protein